VVEASGAPAARALALDLVRPGGVVLLLGESNDPLLMPATPSWRRTDAFYIRSFYFPLAEVPENFALLRRIGADLAARLCTTHPLAELPAVFERFRDGQLIKPVIEISQQ
jgi:threonine dehydrogenase-like Zn-dependent dehydrogenase